MSQWDRIYESSDYRSMIRQKTRAVVVLTVFFVVYYFALPVLVGYWPELMARRAWDQMTWAYLFAFSQFLMAWMIAYLYMRQADRYDRTTAGILASTRDAPPPAQADGGE